MSNKKDKNYYNALYDPIDVNKSNSQGQLHYSKKDGGSANQTIKRVQSKKSNS